MPTHNRVLIGERANGRTVLARHESSTPKYPRWHVRCDCGVEGVVNASTFRASSCMECGRIKQAAARRRHDFDTHTDKLYACWTEMRRRCRTSDPWHGKYYAAKGITVCAEWESFPVFSAWARSNGWLDGLTIDRIDPDGDYEPSNCQLISKSENSRRMALSMTYEERKRRWIVRKANASGSSANG